MGGVERWCLVKEFSCQTCLALFSQNIFLVYLFNDVNALYMSCAGEYVHLCTCQLRTSARGRNQYTVLILGYLGHQVLNYIKEAEMTLSESSRNMLLACQGIDGSY